MVKLNMKTAARILLIITATLMNTECFRIFEKRQESDYSDDEPSFQDSYSTDVETTYQGRYNSYDVTGCLEKITTCASTLFDQPFNGSYGDYLSTLAPIIDQVCSGNRTARTCLRPVLESCRPFEYLLANIDRSLGFFCSNRGKALLREFQQFVCFNEFADVLQYGPICLSEVMSDPSQLRTFHFIGIFYACVIRAFMAQCDEASGGFIQVEVNWSVPFSDYYENP